MSFTCLWSPTLPVNTPHAAHKHFEWLSKEITTLAWKTVAKWPVLQMQNSTQSEFIYLWSKIWFMLHTHLLLRVQAVCVACDVVYAIAWGAPTQESNHTLWSSGSIQTATALIGLLESCDFPFSQSVTSMNHPRGDLCAEHDGDCVVVAVAWSKHRKPLKNSGFNSERHRVRRNSHCSLGQLCQLWRRLCFHFSAEA